MSKFNSQRIRNIVLVGHGAVGKTALADQILFKAGVGSRAGSVDDGTSLLDTDDEARLHHFSISSAMVHFEHHGLRINVIDTPGYPDFIGQTISSICAAETAVITINATAGIEANTRRTFDLAGKANLARIIVINKLDQENVDFASLVDSIRESFGQKCVPMNVPCGLGPDFHDVKSTLKSSTESNGAVVELASYGSSVMDIIAETDDELMERYLDGQELSSDEVLGGINKAISLGTMIPIFCVCAKTGIGVPELMDAIADFALMPGELVRHATENSGQDVVVKATEDGPFVAQVFKTRIDPFVSKMSFIRVLSGKLTKDSVVKVMRTGRGVKIHQLLDVQGGQVEAVDEAHAGDLVVVAKIDEFQVGDTLVNGDREVTLPKPSFPTPMIGLAVEPKSRSDQQKISGALHKIEDEDPTFQITRDPQTHEMVMRGMSDLHLQIVRERLQKRDKVDVLTHSPKVPYRETISNIAEGSYRHKKQSGGSGQFAEVHLRIYPLPQGIDPETYFTRDRFECLREHHYDAELNFAFLDCVTGGSVPNQFIPAVEKGIRETMDRGVIAGYQMQDLAVALFFGKDHPVDSNEAAFRTAASHCFSAIFKQAMPMLLEPVMHLEITIPGERLGDITSDLNSRRGRMEGIDPRPGGIQVVKARAPLGELMTYARSLSSMTGGQGSFEMRLNHYEPVPPNEQHKIVTSIQLKSEND